MGGSVGGVGVCALGLLAYFFLVLRPSRRGRAAAKALGSPHARGGASGFGAEGEPFSSPHRAPLVSFAPTPVAESPLSVVVPGEGFEMVRPGTSAAAAMLAAVSMSPRVSMNPLLAARGGSAAGGGGGGGGPRAPAPDNAPHQHWNGAGPASSPPPGGGPRAPVDEWEQVEDEAGEVFWRSSVTGATAWVRPGSGAWERVVDEEGDMFWYHTETGESSWTRPPTAAAAWERVTDHNGDVWWVHCDTGSTSWHDPNEGEWELVCGPVGQTWFRNTATNAVAWEKPPSGVGVHGWQRVVDPDDEVFYRHEETGALSWTLPAGPRPTALPRAPGALAPRLISKWTLERTEDGSTRFTNVDTGETRFALPPSGVVVKSGARL